MIVCNRQYLEIYGLNSETVQPGMTLSEIVDLRYSAGTAPKMAPEKYLSWRKSAQIVGQESDTMVELTNGLFVRIRHRPMPGGGWVATHEDFTERYRTETALAQAKAMPSIRLRRSLRSRKPHQQPQWPR